MTTEIDYDVKLKDGREGLFEGEFTCDIYTGGDEPEVEEEGQSAKGNINFEDGSIQFNLDDAQLRALLTFGSYHNLIEAGARKALDSHYEHRNADIFNDLIP